MISFRHLSNVSLTMMLIVLQSVQLGSCHRPPGIPVQAEKGNRQRQSEPPCQLLYETGRTASRRASYGCCHSGWFSSFTWAPCGARRRSQGTLYIWSRPSNRCCARSHRRRRFGESVRLGCRSRATLAVEPTIHYQPVDCNGLN